MTHSHHFLVEPPHGVEWLLGRCYCGAEKQFRAAMNDWAMKRGKTFRLAPSRAKVLANEA